MQIFSAHMSCVRGMQMQNIKFIKNIMMEANALHLKKDAAKSVFSFRVFAIGGGTLFSLWPPAPDFCVDLKVFKVTSNQHVSQFLLLNGNGGRL